MSLLALLLALAAQAPPPEPEIALERVQGELVCTVRAQEADPHRLFAELARRSGRRLVGAEDLALEPLTVELVERPFGVVIARIARALGLVARVGTDTIELALEPGDEAGVAELEEQAEVLWLQALSDWPTHPRGADAELGLADIQERRGNLAAARSHLALLVEQHPDSPAVPKALLESSLLLQRLGRWNEAWSELSALASMELPHELAVRARLELARTGVALGDPRQALYVLGALEQDWPAESAADLAARLVVRAEIEVARGEAMEALRAVDQAERLNGGPSVDTLALRARALEAAGRFDEASRAWLRIAKEGGEDGRAAALVDAARLALAAGDEVAVLFIHRLAEQHGLAAGVEPWASAARERLGLWPDTLGARSPAEDAARAEALLAAGDARAARDATQTAWLAREGLEEPLRARLAAVRARALGAEGRVDEALADLRTVVRGLRQAELRRGLYLLAGELLEDHGRFDEAVEAYRGRL